MRPDAGIGADGSGRPLAEADAAALRRQDPQWGCLQDARRAGQAAVSVPRRQEHRVENTRGPCPYSRGTAKALGRVAGEVEHWSLITLLGILLREWSDRDRPANPSNVAFGLEPQIGRRSELGHVPTFATPLRHVWKAAKTRHSAPNVGNAAMIGPSLGRGGASALCQQRTFKSRR